MTTFDQREAYRGMDAAGRGFAAATLQAAWSDGLGAVEPWLPREDAPC